MLANVMNGARQAVMIGIMLTLVNGVVARINPSKETLTEIMAARLGGIASGVTA